MVHSLLPRLLTHPCVIHHQRNPSRTMQDAHQRHEAIGVFGSLWKTLAEITRKGLLNLTANRSTVGDKVLSFFVHKSTTWKEYQSLKNLLYLLNLISLKKVSGLEEIRNVGVRYLLRHHPQFKCSTDE